MKTTRCPKCKSKIDLKPARICAKCKNPIQNHHKYYFKTTSKQTVLVHRNCERPDLYI